MVNEGHNKNSENNSQIQAKWGAWGDLVKKGYDAQHDGKRNEMIQYWWEAWEQFQKIIAKEAHKKSLADLMTEQNYQYPLDAWLADLEIELGNEKEPEKRRTYCQEVLKILDWNNEDSSNFLGAIGESFYAEGKAEEGKAWFEECRAKDPQNMNLLSIYSWCVEQQEGMQAAYELIHREIANAPCTMENCGLFEQAQFMAKKLGFIEEFNRLEEILEEFESEMEKRQYENMVHDDYSMQLNTPVVKEKKIYPNDPCPCGSGKKYKKCCGKNK